MTTVVAILSKRGIAIAADSAVTRRRNCQNHTGPVEKVTKNGNKTIRLSNKLPICVMVTGNADFLGNPWDIILRRYRQEQGDKELDTVKEYVDDLMKYIAGNDKFWSDKVVCSYVAEKMEALWSKVSQMLPSLLYNQVKDGAFPKSKTIISAYIKQLKKLRKVRTSPHFDDYGIDTFRASIKQTLDRFFNEKTKNEEECSFDEKFPREVLDGVRGEFEQTLHAVLLSPNAYEGTELIFTGFGKNQEYPSLVPVCVNEGIDKHVNYMIGKGENISDTHPVAICPFAQTDVIDAILYGEHERWVGYVREEVGRSINEDVFCEEEDDDTDIQTLRISAFLASSGSDDSFKKYHKQQRKKNRLQWEKALKNYDLKAMAALASSLVELTGFQRILTFQQEGVGGEIDLAVITKTDGFSWLSRKSWYHHKDVNGSYGSLGI
jgi:hypothetical protein